MTIRTPEFQSLDDRDNDFRNGIGFGEFSRQLHAVEATVTGNLMQNVLAHGIRQRAQPLLPLIPEQGRAEAPRGAQCLQMDLIVGAGNQRPDLLGKFRPARRNHEAYRAIDRARRMGANESGGLAGLQRVNRCVFRRLLRDDERTDFTLDIDATQIVAEKREARYTYKGEKGYMPMVGHIAENSLAIDHEFREGNAAPAAGNLEFVQACERNMPKGKKIKAVRADSAAYQAEIFNYCEETGKVFAIGADQDAAVKAAIAAIPEGEWKTFRDGEIAETVHCMNKTDKAFRLIVMRRPRELDLFEDRSLYRYHAIASNRPNEDAAVTMEWYSQRGDASENRIKDLKVGFGMEYMPCGSFQANAVFFAIGVLSYNLYLGFRSDALGSGWQRSQVQTVRWQLFQTAGKIVRHGRQMFLKISAAMLDMFAAIRERCARIMQQGGAIPETS